MKKLNRDFYDRETVVVAKELLGKYLIHRSSGVERVGRIVEVEAYVGPHDLASHASKGLTKRTQVMFGQPGRAYIYMIYGMYYCMNVVTEREGYPAAVLIRAVEPIHHIHTRTQGPGLLCKAMGIDKALNACDLMSDHFYVAEDRGAAVPVIVKRPRIGVGYAKHWAKRLLRFYIKGNDYISIS